MKRFIVFSRFNMTQSQTVPQRRTFAWLRLESKTSTLKEIQLQHDFEIFFLSLRPLVSLRLRFSK